MKNKSVLDYLDTSEEESALIATYDEDIKKYTKIVNI